MKNSKGLQLAFLVLIFVLIACAPTPRHTLSTEEKKADLQWVFSNFQEDYAPLNYKENLYGYKFAHLKRKYLKQAGKTKTNEEFFELLFSFFSEFKDAHSSASLIHSDLPGRAKIAYLGFGGKRMGDAFLVTELLPTIQGFTSYPITSGDLITKMDGAPLSQIVLNKSVKYRDLGQKSSNLTYHMPRLFMRVSDISMMPKNDSVKLTVLKGGSNPIEITLPWITKDLQVFIEEQRNALGGRIATTSAFSSIWQTTLLDAALEGFNGNLDLMPDVMKRIIPGLKGFKALNTFEFVDSMPLWSSKIVKDTLARAARENRMLLNEQTAQVTAEFEGQRQVPSGALFLQNAHIYPTYIKNEPVTDAKTGEEIGIMPFAYMYLNTFAPEAQENEVISEVQDTLDTLQANRVPNLVIDLINNGGGSLSLGMKLAQLLSNQKVIMPDMQFRLNETWLDEFEKVSLKAPSDVERELARRVFVALKEDQAHGLRLSRRWNAETLIPYELQPNTGLTQKFNIVLLVNEMCASMCDIFTGILKDNKIAFVVGSQTMGAGGNVVQIQGQAPNSHLTGRQTESLVLRMDGTYIENNGVEPDITLPAHEVTTEKYTPVQKAATQLLKMLHMKQHLL